MSMNIAPVDEELRSVALPFAVKPKNLNGELVGDFGFDPFKFTDNGKQHPWIYTYTRSTCSSPGALQQLVGRWGGGVSCTGDLVQ
jgi:hypothetical protein